MSTQNTWGGLYTSSKFITQKKHQKIGYLEDFILPKKFQGKGRENDEMMVSC